MRRCSGHAFECLQARVAQPREMQCNMNRMELDRAAEGSAFVVCGRSGQMTVGQTGTWIRDSYSFKAQFSCKGAAVVRAMYPEVALRESCHLECGTRPGSMVGNVKLFPLDM